jgi:hypothetical protein
MDNQIIPEPTNIRQRMIALIQALLLENNQLEDMVKKSNFQKHFKPVILGLVRQLPALIGPMLDSVSDDELRGGLVQIRDEFLPFLIGDEEPKKQTYTHNEELPRDMVNGIDPDKTPALAELGKEKSFRIGTNENSPGQ